MRDGHHAPSAVVAAAVVAVGRCVLRGDAETIWRCQAWWVIGRRHTHSQTAVAI